jgi:hypothetical protein
MLSRSDGRSVMPCTSHRKSAANPWPYIGPRAAPSGAAISPLSEVFSSKKSMHRSMFSPNSPRPGVLPLARNAMPARPTTATLRPLPLVPNEPSSSCRFAKKARPRLTASSDSGVINSACENSGSSANVAPGRSNNTT